MKIRAAVVLLMFLAIFDLSAEDPASVTSGEIISDNQAILELARVLRDAKRYDEALTRYKSLLDAEFETDSVRQEMAQILFWQKKTAEARELLEKVPAKSLGLDGQLTLIDIQIGAKQYAAAEASLRSLLEKKPDELGARFRLAQVLSWSKRFEPAFEQFRIILKARPEDKQVRRQYATVLGWAGRVDEAAAEFKKTLD